MRLHVKAIEANDVPKMDTIGKSDPYLEFRLSTSSQVWKTKYKKNTYKPVWNQQFDLPITTQGDDVLTVTLYDYDTVSKSDKISYLDFPIRDFVEDEITDKWYDFTSTKSSRKGGKVRLAFHYAQPGVPPFKDRSEYMTREVEPEIEPEPEPQPEPEPEPQPEPEPEPEPQPEPEPEPAPSQELNQYEEYPEEKIDENASQEVKEEHEWNHNVREITKVVNDLTEIKAINFCYVDRLINIRGKNKPIAFYLKPVSSELSPNGVFIYDTTRLAKDRNLYLFVGPEANQFLEKSGEKLLEMLIEETKCPNVIRIIRDMNSPDFDKMIHQMGGSKKMILSSNNYGDQFFFQNQFFKTLFHVYVFTANNQMEASNDLNFDTLPPNCAAVIDTSDSSLYLYVDHVDPTSEEEKQTQNDAITWMGKQPQLAKRELLVFDKSKIPCNLKLLCNK